MAARDAALRADAAAGGQRLQDLGQLDEAEHVGELEHAVLVVERLREMDHRAGLVVDAQRLAHLLDRRGAHLDRSEEHTSELQSLMRISYAVFCLKNKNEATNDPTVGRQ